MILRLSQKLARKIGESPSQLLPLDTNPYADWSAHLFTAERVQYLLVTNTASLFSMLIYGRGITNGDRLIKNILSCLSEFMRDYRQGHIFEKYILPSSDAVSFSKALNRGVTGSMNDLIFNAKFHLIEEGLSPFEAAIQLNAMPMSYLEYNRPREAFVGMHT